MEACLQLYTRGNAADTLVNRRSGGPQRGTEKMFTPLGIELRFSSPSLSPYTYFRESKVTRHVTTHKRPCAGYEITIALRRRCKFFSF